MMNVPSPRAGARLALVALLASAAVTADDANAQVNTVALPGADRAVEVRAEPVFRVGSAEGEDWETFGEVTAVEFDAAGNLYVLDGLNHRVVVIDRNGAFVRTIGRQGGGPGEFQMPAGMTVGEDGSLVVYDRARRAFSLLGPDGAFQRSVATDAVRDGGMAMGSLAPADGGFWALYRGLDLDTGDPTTSARNGDALVLRRIAGNGATATLKARNPGSRATMVARPGEMNVQMGPAPAFTVQFDWDVLPDGRLAWIDRQGWAVTVAAPDGGTTVFTRPIEPRATTDRDRREERERRLEALESTGAGAPVMVEEVNGVRQVRRDIDMGRRMLERLEFADTRAVLAELAVDGQGRIWVRRTGERVTESGPVDVFTADGRYLGSTRALDRLPEAFGPDGLAAFVRTDDYGVQAVEVMRVGVGAR